MSRTSPAVAKRENTPGTILRLPVKQSDTNFRFSGHQTFALRMAWLPKAVVEIVKGNDPLTDIDEGITKLGLGKNMVEALRCWVEAFKIAFRTNDKWTLTPIGKAIFHPSEGFDPFFEDVTTSWVLHWLISTNERAPFFAWECVFNRWPAPDFSASQVLAAFEKECSKMAKPHSPVTLQQHWEIFLHSYRPSRGAKGEDHLDSAMSSLRLIRDFGERQTASGKWEKIYSFDTSPKLAIPDQLFTYFVNDWWNTKYVGEQTIPIRELVLGNHSPGRLLKMQESEIVQRVSRMARAQPKIFQIVESKSIRQVHRRQQQDGLADLAAAYKTPVFG